VNFYIKDAFIFLKFQDRLQMVVPTFHWMDMGHENTPLARSTALTHTKCSDADKSTLDLRQPNPTASQKIRDETPLGIGNIPTRFYQRAINHHVYVPLIDADTPLPTFWDWVARASDQDPASVVFPMFLLLCKKCKTTLHLDTAKKFMEVYKMTSGATYDSAVANAWKKRIETQMKDPAYKSKKAIDLIGSMSPPIVQGKARVGKVGGGNLTKSKSSNAQHLSIGVLLVYMLLLGICSLAIGHIFMWEAMSFVLSKVHPDGVFTSASAMKIELTGRQVNVLVFVGPCGVGYDDGFPTRRSSQEI